MNNITQGISPKVKAFLAVVGGPGLILLILGIILKDDTLRAAGIAALGGAGIGSAAGYAAPPGEVVSDVGPASDSLLGTDAQAGINADAGKPGAGDSA